MYYFLPSCSLSFLLLIVNFFFLPSTFGLSLNFELILDTFQSVFMFFVQKIITFNGHALFFKRKTKTLQSKPLYSQLGFLVFYSLKERKIVLNKNSEFFVRVMAELARFQLRSVWPQGFYALVSVP